MEKLDHLQGLGINCLELLPVQEFNEMEYHQARLSHCLLPPSALLQARPRPLTAPVYLQRPDVLGASLPLPLPVD